MINVAIRQIATLFVAIRQIATLFVAIRRIETKNKAKVWR